MKQGKIYQENFEKDSNFGSNSTFKKIFFFDELGRILNIEKPDQNSNLHSEKTPGQISNLNSKKTSFSNESGRNLTARKSDQSPQNDSIANSNFHVMQLHENLPSSEIRGERGLKNISVA